MDIIEQIKKKQYEDVVHAIHSKTHFDSETPWVSYSDVRDALRQYVAPASIQTRQYMCYDCKMKDDCGKRLAHIAKTGRGLERCGKYQEGSG